MTPPGWSGKNSGTISNSYATGSVTSDGSAGGLVELNDGTIIASYATGEVSGGAYVGGLASINGGTIIASYATGSVSNRRVPTRLAGWSGI